jgi:hypothetical protein
MNRRLATALTLLLGVSACKWGVRPENYAPANAPEGARVAVRVTGESADRVGELFAVDTSGIIIYNGKLQRVSWPRIQAMDVDRLGSDYDISFGEQVGPVKRARLAPLSRFPQGLSGDLLRAVLAKIELTGLEEIR